MPRPIEKPDLAPPATEAHIGSTAPEGDLPGPAGGLVAGLSVGPTLAGARMRSPSDADLAELVGSLDDAEARHMLWEARRLADAIEARLSGSAQVAVGSPDSETLTVELTRDVYTTDPDLGARGGIRKRLRTGDVVPQPRAGLLLQRHREAVKVVKA